SGRQRGESIDNYETRMFQEGKKRIAIISTSAAEGISLHSDLTAENQQRRHQYPLELGWSADTTMQTFGRSHRNNQRVPPILTLVFSDVAGEKRFAATIAKRLASLGALTRGQRDAASGAGQMSQYNFETTEGSAALRGMYRSILGGEEVPGIRDLPRY